MIQASSGFWPKKLYFRMDLRVFDICPRVRGYQVLPILISIIPAILESLPRNRQEVAGSSVRPRWTTLC